MPLVIAKKWGPTITDFCLLLLPNRVEPLTPPIYYARPTIATEPDAVASQPTSTSTAVPWDGYLDRTTGRSLSESTQFSTSSTSTYPSELLATPPTYQAAEPFFAVNDEPTYPASTALGGHPSFMDIHPPATGGKQQHRWTSRFSTTIPKDQNTSSPDTQLLLADRGDSTAKLVPKQQGGYELDVEIGGNAIVFDPEKPTQIQYRGSDISAQGTPVSKPQELSTRVLLADRGDNTARLVPTADGAYVLDVSIGGKKLIINPERPSEIQYHDSQGLVVTQSLFSPEITAQ